MPAAPWLSPKAKDCLLGCGTYWVGYDKGASFPSQTSDARRVNVSNLPSPSWCSRCCLLQSQIPACPTFSPCQEPGNDICCRTLYIIPSFSLSCSCCHQHHQFNAQNPAQMLDSSCSQQHSWRPEYNILNWLDGLILGYAWPM